MPTLHTQPRAHHRDRWHARPGGGVSLVRDPARPRPADLAALPEAVEIDLARTALMIVDMQNDFLHPEGWFAAERGADVNPLHAIVPLINALSTAARDAGLPVLHLNWGVREDGLNLPANVLDKAGGCGARPAYGDAGTHGPILARGGWGAKSVEAIEVGPADIRVDKHRLSGFRDNALDQILRRMDVTTLIYTGVNLDRCVFATLMDGCFQGFDAVLAEDACATPSPAHVGEAILYLVRTLYGCTTTAADLLAALSPPHDEGALT